MPVTVTYEVHLLGTTLCGADTLIARFDKPEGYSFVAGQYGTLEIDTPEGPQKHAFTHAQAPDDDWIEVATRTSPSAYKQTLMAMKPGDVARLSGPYGRLTLAEDTTEAIFLVGGVGVTPARSICRDTMMRRRPLRLWLFYGNRDETCMPYRDEFDAYAMEHDDVNVIHVLERPTERWTGERGFITAEMVRKHLGVPADRPVHRPGRHWFVAGPPAMDAAMERVLADLGVPKDDYSMELFTGY